MRRLVINLTVAIAVLAVLGSAGAASIRADQLVTPPAYESTPGGLQGTSPFRLPTNFETNGSRNQVIYSSSFFAGVGSPLMITTIQFRPINVGGSFFGNQVDISNVSIRLSTTSRSPNESSLNLPSTTFADNIGSGGLQTVYSGRLVLTTTPNPPTTGLRDFDYSITLQTPFVYDPTQGNLLLDVLIPNGATVVGNGFANSFPGLDTTLEVGVGLNDGIFSVTSVSSASATGTLSSAGPITRFQFNVQQPSPVPEPATLFLLGTGLAGLAAKARSRHKARKSETA